MATTIFVDSTFTISLVFTDYAGAAIDPTAIALVIKDSVGTTKATLAIGDLTQDGGVGSGLYHYHHDTASTDASGVWRVEVKATIASLDEVTVYTWNMVTPANQWVSASEVKQYALVNYTALNISTGVPFANQYEFDTFLDRFLIPRAQAHINAYCKRDFDADYTGSTIPEAIRDICARAAANMIQYMVMNRMGPLVTTGAGYKLRIPTQEVIPADLADLLESGGWVNYTVPMAVTRWGD